MTNSRILLSIMLSLLLVGCDSNDVVETEEEQQPISFGYESIDETAVTRASGLEDSRTTFYVYGYKTLSGSGSTQEIFSGYRVNWVENTAGSTASNTADWEYVGQGPTGTYQTIKYWDLAASEYRFFGIATADLSAPSVTTSGSDRIYTFTADATSDAEIAKAPYISDLWVTDEVSYAANRAVTLAFRKAFCKVRIKFIDENDIQYVDKDALQSPSFAPSSSADAMITKGSLTFTYPTSGTSKEYSFTSSATSTIAAITEPYETETAVFAKTTEKWYTFLPNPAQGIYHLTCTLRSEAKDVAVPAAYMSWKPGYSYTYIFKVPEKGGDIQLVNVVEVAIQKWEDDSTTHSVYNW